MGRMGTIVSLLLLVPVIVFGQYDLELVPHNAELVWLQYEPGPSQLTQLINHTNEDVSWSVSPNYQETYSVTFIPSSGTVPANSSMPLVVMKSGNWYEGDHAVTETQIQIVPDNEGVEPFTMFLVIFWEEADPALVNFGIYQDQVVVGPDNGYISFYIDFKSSFDQEYPDAHLETTIHTANGHHRTCIDRDISIPTNTTFFRHVVQPISDDLEPGIHTYTCTLRLQDGWVIEKEFQFYKQ